MGGGGGPTRPAASQEPIARVLYRRISLVALALCIWSRIFDVWFAQDDFRWLHRAGAGAASLSPRVLSMGLYFQAMRSVFGLRPEPYHLVQLVLHVATMLLLYSMLQRRVSETAAVLAAASFVTAPALFDSLHWISDIADSLAVALLGLAAWLLAGEGDRARRGWLAILAYALALASKEIAVGAAPALALLHWRQGDRTAKLRAALCALLAIAAAIPASGAWQTGTGEPYALRPLAALGNLPAFLTGASLGFTAWAAASDLTWSRQHWVQVAGWILLAAWLSALLRRGSGPAWLGFLWFMGLLAPVVMLERHFYLYYLACALPGLAASVAFLAPARPPRALGSALAIAGALLLVANFIGIHQRYGSRLSIAPLPTDFVLRRAVIAHHAIEDLRRDRAALRPAVVLLGQQPVAVSASGTRSAAPAEYHRDPWLDDNVRAALSEGEAVLVMFPEVRRAVFQPWLTAADTACAVAAYRYDGHLQLMTYATFLGVPDLETPVTREEHEARARQFLAKRLFLEARRELEAALTIAPRDPTLLLNLGAVQANMGDSLQALASFERAVAAAPHDAEALYDLGLLEWRLGRLREARATFEQLERWAKSSDLARSVRELLNGQAK